MTAHPDPLLVPTQVDALALTEKVKDNDPFYRWSLDFRPGKRRNPEGEPFTSKPPKKEDVGVFLQWRIPEALSRGRIDLSGSGDGDSITYPPAPNRWLVVRYARMTRTSAPSATGWIVQSDHVGKTRKEGTSPYLRDGKVIYIGRKHKLDAGSPWKEPGSNDDVLRPLTAVGPDLPTFAAFQPYNQNVFSFHDPATGLPDTGVLSYLVVGWHSRTGDDVLHADNLGKLLAFYARTGKTEAQKFVEALEVLNWEVSAPQPVTRRMLCVGTVLGMEWDRTNGRPKSKRPGMASSLVNIGVGHSATDALDALVKDCTLAPGRSESEADRKNLFTAFHSGKLDELDTVLDGSDSTLRSALHAGWFRRSSGGHVWQVVERDAPKAEPVTLTDEEATTERELLRKLNDAQAHRDQAAREAGSLQGRLADLWWAWGLAAEKSQFRTKAQPHFSTTQETSLRKRVANAANALAGWDDKVAKQAAELRQKLRPGRALTLLPLDPFHEPDDPTVLLYGDGVDSGTEVSSVAPLRVRRPGELVTSGTFDGKQFSPPSTLPKPGSFDALKDVVETTTTALPWTVFGKVLGEFATLEAAAAHALGLPEGDERRTKFAEKFAPATGQRLPESTRLWEQAWEPLFLLWKADVHALPYAPDGTQYWEFARGHLKLKNHGDLAKIPALSASGRCCIAPLPTFAVQRRVDSHIETFGDTAGQDFAELRTRAGSWPMVAQRLDGLNAWLTRRAPGFLDPGAGPEGMTCGRRPVVPRPDWGATTSVYQAVRAAQLAFSHVVLVDRFGRAAPVVLNAEPEKFRPRSSSSMSSDVIAPTTNKYRYVHLPPRLPQPARLRFDLISHRTVDVVDPNTDPDFTGDTAICGWVMSTGGGSTDRRDLVVYDPQGRGLGQAHLIGPPDHRAVTWVPLPGSPWQQPADLFDNPAFAESYPNLAAFLHELVDKDADKRASGQVGTTTAKPQRLRELLMAVNHSLLTTAPPRDDDEALPSLLVGRPLVLLRARLRLELDATPLPDATWDSLLAAAQHDHKPQNHPLWNVNWRVHLGNEVDPRDGLVGYYTAATLGTPRTDYTRLHVGSTHGFTSPEYLKPGVDGSALALPARPTTTDRNESSAVSRYVTLLVDPWSAVHAYTDILPASALKLPEQTVRAVLKRMRIGIPAGPVLAGNRRISEPESARDTVVIPLSARLGETGMSGVWCERRAQGAWGVSGVTGADALAHLADPSPAARNGFLTVVPHDEQLTSTTEEDT
ncbi:hypothetical protein SAMN04487905_1229 [Actinopolyspora xinjiangensis]|uniref:Uncharacterized protein n=1 Tax=Actinopolyspora xinjiangensis TaxID=405564 RepID=A0A1H0X1M4_9ACTN|nr:hypothetical protein [Actinopolyspora xinjiangensis]SDP96868.1 hypothetical protein SAMN04487905_1229 [Actinopolyspora xinjiangensis]